ncbi:N2227-domain-containing protein [Nadsonia fulvescens var. elongata DSM 6958]|uniref:carnosine N-methyltransferase n=1 Tax=Nadsonia fulvescens var. elongata DSM 6958 TaxID=857566 RepID=A0A1E3PJ43_9ASCO|nr:N2227-domain-containing protein [Nadsonia fulvescens var. elongata DSM 6958]
MDTGNEEDRVKTRTLNAYYGYSRSARQSLIEPRIKQYQSLSPANQAVVSDIIPPKIDALESCIRVNSLFFTEVANGASELFEAPDVNCWTPATVTDEEKMLATLKQITREWTLEGYRERNQSFILLTRALCMLFPLLDRQIEFGPLEPGDIDLTEVIPNDIIQQPQESRRSIRVLVPGCGLGRLPFEIFLRGFEVQGNEVSYHMLFAASYFLHSGITEQRKIHPFIHTTSHTKSRYDQLRSVPVPDINPTFVDFDSDYLGGMSMAAGSFDDVYGKHNKPSNALNYDVIVSCFFIDTSANILQTLRTMHHALKPGGFLINFGPLLWHFEGHTSDELTFSGGLEFTRDEVWTLLTRTGFQVVCSRSDIKCAYTANERAMGRFIYNCEFFVAVKV